MSELISENERNYIEQHPLIKTKKMKRMFIFRHYEKCYYFIREILEAESITVREHRILKEMMRSKNRNETRGKHILPFVTGMVSLRYLLKTNSYFFKILLVSGYYLIVFDMSYTLGLHLFNLLQFPSIFNSLLRLNDGESIQSMQTKLFIKKCLLDQYREDNKLIPITSWKNSYILNEALWKNLLKARKSLFINRV